VGREQISLLNRLQEEIHEVEENEGVRLLFGPKRRYQGNIGTEEEKREPAFKIAATEVFAHGK